MENKAVCDFCSKLFTDGELLRQHVRNQHGNQSKASVSAVEQDSLEAVRDYLKSDDPTPKLRDKARVAVAFRGVEARNRQSAGAREALTYAMCRDLSQSNPEQLQKYLQASMPNAPILKALPASKT